MKRDWLAVTIIFWSLTLVAIGYMLALTGSQHPLASGLLWALIILTIIHGIRLAKIDRFLKRRLDSIARAPKPPQLPRSSSSCGEPRRDTRQSLSCIHSSSELRRT